MEQELIDFLKDQYIDSRLTLQGRWLIWLDGVWLVQVRPPYAKVNRCLYSGNSLSEALKALKGER
jgi:hypothetical protein